MQNIWAESTRILGGPEILAPSASTRRHHSAVHLPHPSPPPPPPPDRADHGGCVIHPPRHLRAPPLLLPRSPLPHPPPRHRGPNPPRPMGSASIARGEDRLAGRFRVLAAERPLAELEQPAAQGDNPPRRLRLRALAHRHGVPRRPQAHRGTDGPLLRQDPRFRARKVCMCNLLRLVAGVTLN
jgi:hypothetical protein